MSNEVKDIFLAKSEIKAADLSHRRKINFNIGKYNAVVPKGKEQFEDLHLARERAKNIKWRAIETLDQQLENFEAALLRGVEKWSGLKMHNRPVKRFFVSARSAIVRSS